MLEKILFKEKLFHNFNFIAHFLLFFSSKYRTLSFTCQEYLQFYYFSLSFLIAVWKILVFWGKNKLCSFASFFPQKTFEVRFFLFQFYYSNVFPVGKVKRKWGKRNELSICLIIKHCYTEKFSLSGRNRSSNESSKLVPQSITSCFVLTPVIFSPKPVKIRLLYFFYYIFAHFF